MSLIGVSPQTQIARIRQIASEVPPDKRKHSFPLYDELGTPSDLARRQKLARLRNQ